VVKIGRNKLEFQLKCLGGKVGLIKGGNGSTPFERLAFTRDKQGKGGRLTREGAIPMRQKKKKHSHLGRRVKLGEDLWGRRGTLMNLTVKCRKESTGCRASIELFFR